MARSRYRLTPALQERIVACIRAGGYPNVAAEAAGVPRQVFARWLKRGQRSDAPPAYREFARLVMEAHAQARLRAELTTMTDKPLDWLKAGPGKDSADNPGWASTARPRSASTDGLDKEQFWAEMFALMGECMKHLEAYPEARAHLAELLVTARARKMAPDGTN